MFRYPSRQYALLKKSFIYANELFTNAWCANLTSQPVFSFFCPFFLDCLVYSMSVFEQPSYIDAVSMEDFPDNPPRKFLSSS